MNKTKDFIFKLSALLILVAVISYLFNPVIAAYIMILGVIGFGITTFMTPYPGKSLRGKRLFSIQVSSIIFMAISAYLMFTQKNEWVITMLAAAFLLLYTTFMLSRELDKEKKEEEKK